MALQGTINGTTSNKYITAKVEWTATQNIVGNYSTITATLYFKKSSKSTAPTEGRFKGYIVIDGKSHYIEYKTKLLTNDTWVKYGTATQQVEHNTDGSKAITISANGGNQESGTTFTSTNLSQNVSLDAIPRNATLTSAPNFNDEENPVITYSNPAGEVVENLQVCISLTGEVDNVKYRNIPKTGTTYTFTLTDEDRSMLRYNTNSGSTQRTVYFILATTIGGVVYKSTLAKTLTIVNCQPVIIPSVKDVGSASVAITGNENIIIRGYNYVLARMENQLYKGATIVSQTITCGNSQLKGATGGADAMEGGFNNTETPTFVFSLTDSRGLTTTQTVVMEMVEYFKPTINLEVSPPTAQGELEVKFSGKWFNGKLGNTQNRWQTFVITYEEDGTIVEQFEVENDLTLNGNDYSYSLTIPNLNYKATYDIVVHGYDLPFGFIQATKRVKLLPVFDWGKDDFAFNVPVSKFILQSPNGTQYQISINDAGTLTATQILED